MSKSNDFGKKCVNKCNENLADKLQELHSYLSRREAEIVSEVLDTNKCSIIVRNHSIYDRILSLVIALSRCALEDKILLVIKDEKFIDLFSCIILNFFGNCLSFEVIKCYKNVEPNWVPNSKLVIVASDVLTDVYENLKINESHTVLKQNSEGRKIRHYKRVDEPLCCNSEIRGLGTFYAINWGVMIIYECEDYYLPKRRRSKPIYALCAKHRLLLIHDDIPNEIRYTSLFGYHLLLNDKRVPDNLPDFRIYIKSDLFAGVQHTMILW